MFLDEVDKTAKAIKPIARQKNVKIFCQFDTDGISSAAILVKLFLREGINFELKIFRQLTSDIIQQFSFKESDFLVFADFGSGQLDRLQNCFNTTQILILDHHEPVELNHINVFHLNPLLSGEQELSSSVVSYLFAKAVNIRNADSVDLAIVGAIGDIQDEKWELKGMSRKVLEEAQTLGKISVMKGLRLYGRQSRAIYKSLAYCFDPFIPGISGSETQAQQFLSDLGIDAKHNGEWKKLKDLTLEEQKILATAIIVERLKFETLDAADVFGEIYTMIDRPEELQDVREFSTLVNACGRTGRHDIALRLCLGDYSAIETSWSVIEKYRKMIGDSLGYVRGNISATHTTDFCNFILGENKIPDTLIGTVISIILNSNMIDRGKPVFGFADTENDKVKVSARISEDVKVDLGKLVRQASAVVGGEGGGHYSACGALIPKGKEQEFINSVNSLLGGLIGSKKIES